MKTFSCCVPVCTAFSLLAFVVPGSASIENRGRVDQAVKYYAPGSWVGVYLTQDAVVLNVREAVPGSFRGFGGKRGESRRLLGDEVLVPGEKHGCAVYNCFEGANPSPVIEARGELAAKYNYFLGNDPSKWCTDVGAYEEVVYMMFGREWILCVGRMEGS